MTANREDYLRQVEHDHANAPRAPLLLLLITLPLSLVIHGVILLARAIGFNVRTVDERIADQRRQHDIQAILDRADENYRRQMAEHACMLADHGMLSPEMRRWLPADHSARRPEDGLPSRLNGTRGLIISSVMSEAEQERALDEALADDPERR